MLRYMHQTINNLSQLKEIGQSDNIVLLLLSGQVRDQAILTINLSKQAYRQNRIAEFFISHTFSFTHNLSNQTYKIQYLHYCIIQNLKSFYFIFFFLTEHKPGKVRFARRPTIRGSSSGTLLDEGRLLDDTLCPLASFDDAKELTFVFFIECLLLTKPPSACLLEGKSTL